nr:Ribonucleoside-diphosphate reductase large subunit [Ipomoea batatas]
MELLLQMEVPRKPPPQKKATVKPIKPEAVIVISPDTKEEVKEKNSLRRKAAAEDSSRKTYTATLTAQSKAACGIAATILSIIMYGSPLSIIRLVIKTKSVEFMPFFLSLFVFLCGTSWFISGLLGKDPFVAIPNGFGCGLGAVQLILYAIYCDKKSFPDGSGKMVGVDGKPSGEDMQLGIRMGQNQSEEDLDIMLCGGSDSEIIPTGVGGFIACRALSQRKNDPTRASLPWVVTAMDLSWVKELEFCFWKNLSMRRKEVQQSMLNFSVEEPHLEGRTSCRDLFYALWVPDLFMERVQSNGQWSLFCPNEAPGLADCCGEEFEELHTEYERKGKAKKVVQAQNLWFEILKSQIETDSCNKKTNQQNLGTIKSSNLCTEIIEYTSPTETVFCNLASIALPRFVREKGVPIESQQSKLAGSRGSINRYFDFDKLAEPDMWGVTPSNQWDWFALRAMIEKNEVRNSLLVAPMPTASTSQILGNNESFEPYTSNIYSRRVLRFAVEGVFAGGIKQKNMAADGRNRRVLFELKASCFLRNVLVLRMWMELLLQMEVPRKPPSQKRATVKPIKPYVVIVISHDTKEEVEEKNSLRRKAAAEDSSRKTYTATLTARSKAACGLNIKLPKEKIEDIDAGDVYNEFVVVEYAEDIYYKEAEGNQELAEDMAITQHSRNRRIKGGTLIVCPMALLGQWKSDSRTRCGLDKLYGLLSAAYKANNVQDFYSLLCFLHVEPWCNWAWWNKLIQRPYENGDQRALKLINAIRRPLMLWRTKETKDKEGSFSPRPYENGDQRAFKAILRPLMLRRTKETKDKEGRFFGCLLHVMERISFDFCTWGYWQYGYLRGAEGKQQLPQVSSPLTRGFCAQLLANAAADKNKVPRKPPSQKRTASLRRKTAAEDSSRKTYTASLTARNKAACGLNIKLPKEKIEDIDAGDVYNELAVVEYAEDIYKFYTEAEPGPKEKVKEKNNLCRRAAAEGSSRKTYTATLTARRMAACGLIIKLPKEKIEDIGAGDE